MLPNRITGPLSPPTSPRMSGQDTKPSDSIWRVQQTPTTNLYSQGFESHSLDPLSYTLPPFGTADAQQRSQSLHHGIVTHPNEGVREPQHLGAASSDVKSERHDEGYAAITGGYSTNNPYTASGASGSADPMSSHGLKPPSPGDQDQLDQDEDDDLEDMEDPGDDESKPPMTAAELRQHKRKMKRFRLTHNQTRFLMSEFARQAHPDAAHRERLSREIPGLSPRQVQVWFQNRRAKLKRLTAEDRNRMMQSRALPDNFNVPQYGGQSLAGAPIQADATHAPGIHRPGQMRPLTLDTLRRGGPEHNFVSPTGLHSALGSLAFTPPQSATDTTSPISTAGDMAAYGYPRNAHMESPRRMAFPPGASSAPLYSSPFPQSGRMSLHDRYRRASGDSVASPLRSSMSYSSFGTGGSSSRNPSTQAQEPATTQAQRDAHRDMPPPPSGPYGLGFNYDPMTHYSPQAPGSGPPSMHSPHASYRSQQGAVGSQSSQFPHYLDYHGATYTPQIPQYSTMSGPYSAPLPSSSFAQHQSQNQTGVTPVPSQPQQYQPRSEIGSRSEQEEVEQDRG